MKSFKEFLKESETYRGSHEAPQPGDDAPMHNVSGIYPDDFHGPDGFRQYADQGNDYDHHSYRQVTRVKNDPEAHVWVHRAIPTKVYKEALKKKVPLHHMIKNGDWVTTSKDYAKEHGVENLKGDYKIASMRAKAKHLYTDGNSIHEWGYHNPDRETQ